MAVYDLGEQRLCVRVVYDGVAGAGKTTNLRQLCNLFATQRTTELYSPAEQRGRTLYFDWVRISAGVVCGFPLLCQVISVPGQLVLTERRRHLLASADVVVYVCDSAAPSLNRARDGLELLDRVARERGETVPVIVQANKQDQAVAVDGTTVLQSLGRTDLTVVEGIATDGIGVVDTFVTAIRVLARTIQTRSENQGMRVRVQRAESAAEVLKRLEQARVDPEWAAEMVLEEAAAALLFDDPTSFAEEAAHDVAPTVNGASEKPEPTTGGGAPFPPLPTADVPTGFIWPAHTGRTTLRALESDARLSEAIRLDANGHAEHVVGNYVLRTSLDVRFTGAELARQALVRAARERAQEAAASDTVLVLQSARDGSCWLWTVTPHHGPGVNGVVDTA